MSLAPKWRQFQLFEFLACRDPHYKSPDPLFSDPLLTAIVSVGKNIVYALHNDIKILTEDLFSLVVRFSAYEPGYSITYMRPLPHSNLLVTMAERINSPSILKIWDLHKIARLDAATVANDDTMRHKYITQVAVQDGDNSFPLTSVLFNDSLTCIAVGSNSGRLILIRGDLLRDRGLRQRVIYESSEPITALRFSSSDDVLFVVTTSRILTVPVTGNNHGRALRVLSKSGGDLGCADMDQRSSRLLVADLEKLTYYNSISSDAVISFQGAKSKILRLFGDYLFIVSPIENTLASYKTSLTKLLILDLRNLHISFALTISDLTILHLFPSATKNEVMLLSNDGQLFKITEKPVETQVQLILDKQLFSIALNLAHQRNLNKKTILHIHRENADFLYEKQDLANAIQKYIECLPLFHELMEEESIDDFVIVVITKFSEVSNIHYMTAFLAKAYDLGLADCAHVTLLLCCYCKLKMVKELDKFIDEIDLDESSSKRNSKLSWHQLNYSLLINLFKECGFFAPIIKLLYKLKSPKLIVDIQLNDLRQHLACMSYIKSLPVNELLAVLIDYLKDLLDFLPHETTKLLIDVFTGNYEPQESTSLFENLEDSVQKQGDSEKQAVRSSYNSFKEYLSKFDSQNSQLRLESPDSPKPTYLPPRPSVVFTCFINHPVEFVIFLEACYATYESYQGVSDEKRILANTLYEMYFSISVEEPSNASEWRQKAHEFGKQEIRFIDESRALLVSQIYGSDMISNLLESSHYEENSFRAAQKARDYARAIQIVRKFGELKPKLYRMMLQFIVSSNRVFQKAPLADLKFVMEQVVKHKLATTQELIKILSSNELATIGLVRDLLINELDTAKTEINNNNKLIESYERESTVNGAKLSELLTKPVIFQSERCSSCSLRLEFPVIYFKCKHSYHQQCLEENIYISSATDLEPRCPLCTNEQRNAREMKEAYLRGNEDSELFQMKLQDADDRFKVMTEYLKRGVMDVEKPSGV